MIDRSALDRLQEIVGDDPADLLDLVETFLADAPDILTGMAAGAADGNLGVVRRHAHSLTSTARDMGATTLANLCAALEADIKDGHDAGDLRVRVIAVQEEWSKAEEALQKEIARLGGTHS